MEGEDQVVSATRRRTGRSVRPIPSPVVEFPGPESFFGEFPIECGDPAKSVQLFTDGGWNVVMMGMMSGEDAEALWNSLPKDDRFVRRQNEEGGACYPYFKLMDGRIFLVGSSSGDHTQRCTKFTLITSPSGPQKRISEGQGYSCKGEQKLCLLGPYPLP
jgi:hypothetical protein